MLWGQKYTDTQEKVIHTLINLSDFAEKSGETWRGNIGVDSKDVRPTVRIDFPYVSMKMFLLSVLGNSGANAQLCVTIRIFVDCNF